MITMPPGLTQEKCRRATSRVPSGVKCSISPTEKDNVRRLQNWHLLQQVGAMRRRLDRRKLAPLLLEQRQALGVEIDDLVVRDRERADQSLEEAAVAAAELDDAKRRFPRRVSAHHGLQPVRGVAPRQMCRRRRTVVILVPVSREWSHRVFRTRSHAGTGS